MESQMAKSYNDLLKEIGDVESKIEVIKSEIERLAGKDKYSENGGDDSNKTVLNFSVRNLFFKIVILIFRQGWPFHR